jgi:hypothetical protein
MMNSAASFVFIYKKFPCVIIQLIWPILIYDSSHILFFYFFKTCLHYLNIIFNTKKHHAEQREYTTSYNLIVISRWWFEIYQQLVRYWVDSLFCLFFVCVTWQIMPNNISIWWINISLTCLLKSSGLKKPKVR